MNRPNVGSKWKHLKTDTIYRVLCISVHSETADVFVNYYKEGSDIRTCIVWCRPLVMFMDGRFQEII